MTKVRRIIDLDDTDYFCNKSWTISFNVNTRSWVSFHSYLPNWYIAENAFFYSGMNGCCDDFDFIAGPMVYSPIIPPVDPPIIPPDLPPIIPPATACALSGVVILTNCGLTGTGIITIPSECKRPGGLQSFAFITGHISGGVTTISTASQANACSSLTFTNNAPDTTPPSFTYTTIAISCQIVAIGVKVYLGTAQTDCTMIGDGWYYTEEIATSNQVIHVVDGVITEIISCV